MIKDSLLNISLSTFVRLAAVGVGLVALYTVADVVAALFFAVIIASGLEPAIEWLKAHKIPRIPAAVLLYLVLGAGFGFFVYLAVPLLFEELRTVASTFPLLQRQFLAELDKFGVLPFSSFLGDAAQGLLSEPGAYLQQFGGGVVNVAASFFGSLFGLVLVVVFSFYLAAQEKGIEKFLRLITPLKHESYVLDLWSRAQKKLGYWVRAQMLLGAIIGVLIFLGLTFLGVKYAILLAALAAALELIPVVGPILAAVPAVSLALPASPVLALWVALLYFVVQQIESHVIVPVVIRQAVGLSPLIVVLALVVGAKLGGIVGVLLAVPLTAIGAELLDDWDKKKRALMPG